VIAGAEDERSPGYAAEILRAIADLRLEDRVILIGQVEGDERWSLYDAADVFVLPSHSENFGIVVAEAMARRCPVVVTDGVQSCSHVIAAGAGKVVLGDVGSLARAMDEVLANPERKKIWGEAGRRYAEVHFRWSSIAEQIRQMYEACIGAV
jgi:glycosyltransferase involved in cell wall biosynthesis